MRDETQYEEKIMTSQNAGKLRWGTALMLALCALLLCSAQAFAQPTTMTTTGRLLDDSGSPVTGSEDITYTIYDAATGGSQVWEETVSVSLDEDGFYTATLGATTPLDGSIFTGDVLYVETTIDGTALEPRVALGSVPYAIKALAVDWSGVLNKPMDLEDGDDDALTALASNCTADQIPTFDGTVWICADPGLPTIGQGLMLAGGTLAFDQSFFDGRYVQEGEVNSIATAMIQDDAVDQAKIAGNEVEVYRVTSDACPDKGELSLSPSCPTSTTNCPSCNNISSPFRTIACDGTCGCSSRIIVTRGCPNTLVGHLLAP